MSNTSRMNNSISEVDGHLEIDPEDVIEFVLDGPLDSTGVVGVGPNSTSTATATSTATNNLSTLKVTLKLTNPDTKGLPIVFKVKTTQPRRYLVRPNQGLIQPGALEKIQIVLVDKDRQDLIRNYTTMGPIALEQCKDKFLVQSLAIPFEKVNELQKYESITALWASNPPAIANKKLHVRHTVTGTTGSSTNNAGTNNGLLANTHNTRSENPADMSQEKLIIELTSLRKKYDELIAFSVNLTAERDMISNTLEVTKRDLQRAIAGKLPPNYNNNSTTNRNNMKASSSSNKSSSSSSFLYVFMLLLIVIAFGMGMAVQQQSLTPNVITQLVQQYLPSMLSPSSTTSTSSGTEPIATTTDTSPNNNDEL